MDSIAIAIFEINSENTQRRRKLKLQRKILRDAFNPFELDDKVFKKNFRLNKAAFKYILEELDQELDPCVFSCSISPISRLAAVLRFIAEGGYQHGVGKDFEIGMAQSTFSTNLKIVLNILKRRLCPVWIKLETTEVEKRQAKFDFYSKAGFPGTIMCVDGTHVKIIAPAEEKFLYFNRKGYFSINAMVICDNKMRVKFIDARYPGSNHDSHVWNLSSAKTHFERKFREGERNTWIIGDAGYPLEPWLITPFRSPEPGSSQSTFNFIAKHGTWWRESLES
ncbi:putative nuclease HARBI1 [Eupeodes corollae]|uniref:putative nuclease HARBI1 n=1 Tax=Eupeodes corollae TaxID=290404 RepID=UPI00249048DB|nr:putative nuclease HARBI1 [Eupeodes corollae]